MPHPLSVVATLAVVLAASTSPAPAGTLARTLARPCSVRIAPIDLGSIRPGVVRRDVPVVVTCPAGYAYRVSFVPDDGCGAAQAFGDRTAATLTIYTPAGSVWCDGSNGTAPARGVGTGAPQLLLGRVETSNRSDVAVPYGDHRANVVVRVDEDR